MTISVILSLPNFINEILTHGFESISFHFYIKLDEIFFLYGILPTIFFIIGFYFASKSRSREIWALLLTSLFLLVNIVVFAQTDINIFLPYQRTFIPLFLLMSIIGSIAVTKICEIRKPWKKISVIGCILLLCVTGIIAINTNLNYSYYRIIDETDYTNAQLIKENTENDDIMICDPWMARAIAPLAERTVYAVSPFGPVEHQLILVEQANDFLNNDCRNTTFLLEHNISIVYSRGYNCYNPDLQNIKPDIYMLKTSEN
jgi:hypothetical protein